MIRVTMSNYRPDIDSLRALAVMLVILYHSGLEVLGGHIARSGYLGVDVFFVISGFLITRLIMSELQETGTLSFAKFYTRRARRILPSLFAVVVGTLFISWVLSPPSTSIIVAQSGLASIFSISNIFWQNFTSSYSSPDSQFQPLLHTWSLGIEEQFYLALPLILFVTYRSTKSVRSVQIVLALTAVVSFAFWVFMGGTSPAISFYSTFARAWELAFGAVLATYMVSSKSINASMATLLIRLLGLIALLVAIFAIDGTPESPSVLNLVAVLATGLIILTPSPESKLEKIFTNRITIWIGGLSYSLYLVHFPLIAFWRQVDSSPQVMTRVIWIIGTFGLGYLLHRFVEQPMRSRNRSRNRTFASVTLSLALIGILGSASLWWQNTNVQKGAVNYQNLLTERWDYDKFDLEVCSQQSANDLCSQDNATILVVGDSMVPDAVRILGANLPEMKFIANTQGGCFPQRETPPEVLILNNANECDQLNKLRFSPDSYKNLAGVALISTERSALRFQEYLTFLRSIGVENVLVFGPYISLKIPIGDASSNETGFKTLDARVSDPSLLEANRDMRELTQSLKFTFVSPVDSLCSNLSCPVFIDGNPFTPDQAHWTNFLTERLSEDFRLGIQAWAR